MRRLSPEDHPAETQKLLEASQLSLGFAPAIDDFLAAVHPAFEHSRQPIRGTKVAYLPFLSHRYNAEILRAVQISGSGATSGEADELASFVRFELPRYEAVEREADELLLGPISGDAGPIAVAVLGSDVASAPQRQLQAHDGSARSPLTEVESALGRSTAAAEASAAPVDSSLDSRIAMLPAAERAAFSAAYAPMIGRGVVPPVERMAEQTAFYHGVIERHHADSPRNQLRVHRYLACKRLGVFRAEDHGRYADVSDDGFIRICGSMGEAQDGRGLRQVLWVDIGGPLPRAGSA